MKKSKIEKIIVCDTIEIDENKKIEKLEIISVSDVFGESIKRIVGKIVKLIFLPKKAN